METSRPTRVTELIIESPHYEWQHSLGEIVMALVGVGLRIESFREFPMSGYEAYPIMERDHDGWWRFPEHNESFPQLFSIRAIKESH